MDHWPISILGVGDTADTHVSVSALIPATGTYAQSTGTPGSDCAVAVNGHVPDGDLPLNGPDNGFLQTPLKDIRLGDLPWSKTPPYKFDYLNPYKDEQRGSAQPAANGGALPRQGERRPGPAGHLGAFPVPVRRDGRSTPAAWPRADRTSIRGGDPPHQWLALRRLFEDDGR
jgi:hypothetical protein